MMLIRIFYNIVIKLCQGTVALDLATPPREKSNQSEMLENEKVISYFSI